MQRVGIVVVIIAVVLGVKFYKQSQSGAEAKDAIQSWIVSLEEYEPNKAYFDKILESAHSEAFDATYEMGGRRRSTTFDGKEYAGMMFQSMKAQAENDNKPEIAKAIDATWSRFKARESGGGK